jgi:hypothetical protein
MFFEFLLGPSVQVECPYIVEHLLLAHSRHGINNHLALPFVELEETLGDYHVSVKRVLGISSTNTSHKNASALIAKAEISYQAAGQSGGISLSHVDGAPNRKAEFPAACHWQLRPMGLKAR